MNGLLGGTIVLVISWLFFLAAEWVAAKVQARKRAAASEGQK